MSHDGSLLRSLYPIIKRDKRFENLVKNDVYFFGLERMVAGVVEFNKSFPFDYEMLNPYPNSNPYIRRQPRNIGELSKLFFKWTSQKIPNLIDYYHEESEGHTYLSTKIFVEKEKPAASASSTNPKQKKTRCSERSVRPAASSTKRKINTNSVKKQKTTRCSERLKQVKQAGEDESVRPAASSTKRTINTNSVEKQKKSRCSERLQRDNSASEDESVDSYETLPNLCNSCFSADCNVPPEECPAYYVNDGG